MSLTERSALRNTIRRRLELLEAVRASLDFADPSDDENESLWGSSDTYTAKTEGESDSGSLATDFSPESPGSDDSDESVDEAQAQPTACSDSQNGSLFHDDEEINNDSDKEEVVPGLDNTQLADLGPLSSRATSDYGTRPTTPTPSEPTSSKPTAGATVAEIAKFRTYRRTLRAILKAVDAHIATTYDKYKKQVEARYAAAVVPTRPRVRPRKHRRRRRVAAFDWGEPFARVKWELEPEPEPELGPRRGMKVAKSRLAHVGTPDDWLWEEAVMEVKESFGLGYSYRRDRVGRRVHRI